MGVEGLAGAFEDDQCVHLAEDGDERDAAVVGADGLVAAFVEGREEGLTPGVWNAVVPAC